MIFAGIVWGKDNFEHFLLKVASPMVNYGWTSDVTICSLIYFCPTTMKILSGMAREGRKYCKTNIIKERKDYVIHHVVMVSSVILKRPTPF